MCKKLQKLNYSMEPSPSWEAYSFLTSQENPLILWNPKVHYRIRKSPPPDPILSQLDPVPTPTSHFLKIRLRIILPSEPGFSKLSFSITFSNQNPIYTSPLPRTRYMPHRSHSTRTILGEEYRLLSPSLCSFLHSPITSSLLGPNVLNALLSTSAYVPPSVWATKFHTHTTQQEKL